MPRYSVEVPIAGRAVIEVEADDAEGAINEALGQVQQSHIEEWDCHRNLVRGNVCYAPITKAEAALIEDE